jgi:DNA-binding transcriptional LysR family regulator
MNQRIDFNLLAAFEALFAEQSVTGAALRHGVTQPAMSNALKRLRDMFDDALFVRAPGGMAPTPKALELAPTIEAALASLRGAVADRGFEPRGSRARFTWATLDYFEVLHAPGILCAVQREAPAVTVQLRRLETIFQLPTTQFAEGSIDCAVGLFPQPLPPQAGLSGQPLGREDLVCLVRRGHPEAESRLTLETYTRLKHIGVLYPGAHSVGMIDRRLAEHGLNRTCALWTPHFTAAPFMVQATDCIATVPRGLAQALAPSLSLKVVELPLPMPALMASLVWTARVDKDPSHRWFRGLVADRIKLWFEQNPPRSSTDFQR